MKIILLLALLQAHFCFAQEYIPPNGIPLKENLFIDATEVANIHWLEYEYYVRLDSGDAYADMNIPSEDLMSDLRPEYFRHKTYRYSPVIGVNYQQVINYNNWRTSVVNMRLSKEGKPWRVLFRLPTEDEWEMAARRVDSISYTIPKECFISILLRSNRKYIREIFPSREIDFKELKIEIENYQNSKVLSFVLDQERPWFIVDDEKLPQPIDDKSFALDHFIGNVAEMVQEKGIVKGGSWKHILATSFPSKRSFVDPNKVYDWVGFRCVAEVYKIEGNEKKKP